MRLAGASHAIRPREAFGAIRDETSACTNLDDTPTSQKPDRTKLAEAAIAPR
jgi:hypothetical protein